jgi:hypothetical protein
MVIAMEVATLPIRHYQNKTSRSIHDNYPIFNTVSLLPSFEEALQEFSFLNRFIYLSITTCKTTSRWRCGSAKQRFAIQNSCKSCEQFALGDKQQL